jgi:hypothetical protein
MAPFVSGPSTEKACFAMPARRDAYKCRRVNEPLSTLIDLDWENRFAASEISQRIHRQQLAGVLAVN